LEKRKAKAGVSHDRLHVVVVLCELGLDAVVIRDSLLVWNGHFLPSTLHLLKFYTNFQKAKIRLGGRGNQEFGGNVLSSRVGTEALFWNW